MVGGNERELQAVLTRECRGDFRVVADGVAVVGKIRAERGDEFVDDAQVGVDVARRGVERVCHVAVLGRRFRF